MIFSGGCRFEMQPMVVEVASREAGFRLIGVAAHPWRGTVHGTTGDLVDRI